MGEEIVVDVARKELVGGVEGGQVAYGIEFHEERYELT